MNEETTASKGTQALFLVAVLLYWASLYFYAPTLPVFAETLTGDLALIGTILSMYGLLQAIVRLPLGILSDWIGKRRRFILLGLLLSAIGALLMGAAQSPWMLLIGRATTGLAAGAWVPFVALFSSLFPPKKAVQATALLSLFNTIGRMAATTVTGSLNNLGGYPLAFYVSAGAAIVALVLVAFAKEPKIAPRPASIRSIFTLITRKDVLLPGLLNAVTHFAAWATAYGFTPILARDLGASNIVQSALMTLNIGMVLVGNLVTSTVIKKIGNRPAVFISVGMMATGIAAAFLAQSLAWLFVSQILTGIAFGIAYPVLMGLSIERVDASERATATGLHQSVYAIGMFAGPSVSGALAAAFGIQPMFAIIGGIALVLGLVGAWLLE